VTRLLPIRGEEPPADTVVIIRAGVMSLDTLRRTASDSFDDFGAYLVSVEAVLGGCSIADTCRTSPRIGQRYGRVRLSSAGRLRSAGLPLLATFASPHFDVVLPDLSDTTLQRLTTCFDEPIDNPGREQAGVTS
jgi:hypothetical protein